MGMIFKDDKPVTCNCGCTVYSGWVTEATMTVKYKGKEHTIIYTYCDEDYHCGMAMEDALRKYQDEEEHQIQTKEDKEKEYADISRDD